MAKRKKAVRRKKQAAASIQAAGHVFFSEGVCQFVAGRTEGHHEREVEEQLQRRRRAVSLVRVATDHAAMSVRF
jgi:hypothetical protein